MKKILLFSALSILALSSCNSKKKMAELEARNKSIQELLNAESKKLDICLTEKTALTQQNQTLQNQLEFLKKNNSELINNMGNLTTLTSKGADNLEKSLESLKEKDMKITRLQDALTKKDSVTFALVTSLKRSVGINDPDIEVNVEKGVVFISIADKLLFQSGSYEVTDRAKEVLAKVAKVINDKPDFECMIEGHTDDVPYKGAVILDNWDLSVKRSTAIVRVLQELHGVNPKQLIAAGRSSYVPLVEGTTPEDRAVNRRTRVVIMPKIDQFYDMIEKEMKNQTQK